ncbi:MAG: [FeFe] hydrogenase H-cluster radical SAM maturase HydE [Ruminococcaceae bacterium]|nr:[FeFe] hydrogenase H-cluster radical SAM maturase HydE [Oscillospiraceae bacterium]
MENLKNLVDRLYDTSHLEKDEYVTLIENRDSIKDYLFSLSSNVREKHYGKDVYLRGLIEFTNYCKNNCYYCGIRAGNKDAERYRLTKEQILECCEVGYALDFRTFVLQGGEDPYYTDDMICDIVREIKARYPDCAVTLSIGEKNEETYRSFFEVGADRYLLRHETADCEHYSRLHPPNLTAQKRQECLYTLKKIGFQTGAGFMVGSPYQTAENLADDLLFLERLKPEMVGIGPFIPHHATPFADMPQGTAELTIFMVALVRLILPKALLPATTALGTIVPNGRELALKVGANVVMPNLSPTDVRSKYLLYDNKICTGDESAQCRKCLESRVTSAGYKVVKSRGDHASFTERK